MSDDDSDLFKEAAKGARPIQHNGLKTEQLIADARKRNLKRMHAPKHSVDTEHHSVHSESTESSVGRPPGGWSGDRDTFPPIEPNRELLYCRSGIPLKRFKHLKSGSIPTEATLDLHGYTLEEAAFQLTSFLSEAKQRGYRCVRIVHGKGQTAYAKANRFPKQAAPHAPPILKSAINHWLPQEGRVLAFCSAPPNQGGRGAVLVLLKRNREQER